MFCKKCGQELKNNHKFCIGCGAQISQPVAEDKPRKDFSITNFFKKYKNNIIIITVIVVLVIAGIYGSSNDDAIKKNNEALKNYDSGASSSQEIINQFQEASKNATEDDTKINTLKNLAYVYSSDSKNDLALSTFKEALDLTSKDSFDYYLISGEVNLLENKPDLAQLNYIKAYNLTPDDFQINNALNLFYLDLEDKHSQYVDYNKALVYAQKAYDVSKLEIAKQNLAIAQYFNKNFDQTIVLLKSSDFTKEPYAAYWLGLAYVNKDDTANAKIYLQKAIDNGAKVPQEINNYLNSN